MSERPLLLVDVGNSRIKAALADADGLVAWPALETRRTDAFRAWRDLDAAPARVLVSNVGGTGVAGELAEFVHRCWGVEAEFPRPRASCAGMTTDYVQPARLGVDRWLAALAGWHAAGGSGAVVLDAGTALTVDVVTAAGRHLGGMIAPGLDLMFASLSRGTADLEAPPVIDVDVFASDSAAAISLGCQSAVRGVLTATRERLAATGEADSMRWFVTGGGAAGLDPMIDWPHELDANLVLKGLLLAAGARP
ncbi:MAG: type III pantothenate kinase [Gammaproteobacteria bacterium]